MGSYKRVINSSGNEELRFDDNCVITFGNDQDTEVKADGTGVKIGTAITQKVGFFNAVPVVQQTVPTTTPTVQQVINALVALGLVKQSD